MKTVIHFLKFVLIIGTFCSCVQYNVKQGTSTREYNGVYLNEYSNRIAFPMGGIGAGMVCLEGTGAFSRVIASEFWAHSQEELLMFGALSVKGENKRAKILEGPVPAWKYFDTGRQFGPNSWKFPRFEKAAFTARFPFASISLNDPDIPLEVQITGWSPFIPGDADHSSLPVGALEYSFKNNSRKKVEAVFSFHAENFMKKGEGVNAIHPAKNGFILTQEKTELTPNLEGYFTVFTDQESTVVDHSWFRGTMYDAMDILWKNIKEGNLNSCPPMEKDARGASLYVPVELSSGEEKTIRVMFNWYTPDTDNLLYKSEKAMSEGFNAIRQGTDPAGTPACDPSTDCYHKPWYSGEFNDINDVTKYWETHYDELKSKTRTFTDAFYNSTLPAEVIEAVAANLSILKSPTVLRQPDGKLWGWEGSFCCPGSCTHVWNYAQAIPHLFPDLERSLRDTEFNESQDERGHQTFRSGLPIRPVNHGFYAAADGQLGGIMKVYRDWRISGDNAWLKDMFPKVKLSMDYCINTWDPRHKGVIEEPQHNTYDIEFWGPNGMIMSFYLGALNAISEMGTFLGEDINKYRQLYQHGKQYMETELYNGEYFIQKIQWKGLNAPDPVEESKKSLLANYSEEAIAILEKEGPKYQYGNGCLSDGVLGCWISLVSGLEDPVDKEKTKSHLLSVYKYNLTQDLSKHPVPSSSHYAFGSEGGLVNCSWPHGDNLSLPFTYHMHVWTGIEYQVASHLMFIGEVEKGLEIVRTCRDRYDGRLRNPFSEIECGIFYARAMSSYALLEGLTGVRYDAVDKVLYIDSRIGDFTSFISTATGFGNVGLKKGIPFLNIVNGVLDVNKVIVSGVEKQLTE